jgi:hypothetical protein
MVTTSIDSLASSVSDYSVWQSRLERWRRIGHLLDRAELAAGRFRDECVDAARSELTLLRDAEALFAYPGDERVASLELQLGRRHAVTAASETRAIVRNLLLRGDAAARLDGGSARYFTVVLVDGRARTLVAMLQPRLDELRRAEDPVAYALVGVVSVEEALCAVRYNPYVEVCLLGERAARDAARPMRLLSDADRRQLGSADAAAPLDWLRDWLRAHRPEVAMPSLTAPETLHRALIG